MKDLERRHFVMDRLNVERRDKEKAEIVGHAAVFNRETNIGGWFIESVAPGAFRRAIAEDDVRSLFNHDPNLILGRNRAGTLKLSEDDTGLMTTTTPPDVTYARDLLVSIERGDVSGMSFGFRVTKQEWDESGDIVKRKILEVELFDISPVTYPAYPQTDVTLRAAMRDAPESVSARLQPATVIHLEGSANLNGLRGVMERHVADLGDAELTARRLRQRARGHGY
jgi:HK97 family phage prohead protease